MSDTPHIRLFRKLLWLPLVLLLSACVPISENPIVVAGQNPADSRLIGAWFGSLDEDDDPMFLHFYATDKGADTPHPGGLGIIMIDHGEPYNDGSWSIMYGLTAEIKGEHYLSVEFKMESEGETTEGTPEYYLFHYKVTEDRFEIRGIDEDLLEEHVEAGDLEGSIEGGQYTTDIRLTSSSAEWVKFLKSHKPDDLFSDEKGAFVRK
jgi:hypothetical protein